MLLAFVLLTSCGAPEPAPQDRFYALEPQVVTPSTAAAPLQTTLLVNSLAARGFLGGRQIVYRTREQPLEVQRYDLLLWEEPPGRAIAGNLATSLRAASLFAFVTTPAQRSQADFTLGGEVDRFEHLPTAEQPRVTADFTLTLVRGADRQPLFSRRYQGKEPTLNGAPEAIVQAFNRLLARLLGEAVRDLQALRPRLGRTGGH